MRGPQVTARVGAHGREAEHGGPWAGMGRGHGEWETPSLGAGNPTSPASGSLVRALGEINRGQGTAGNPREGESVPGGGGEPEWCRGRGSRSAWLPAVTGSRGGAACAARAGAKSGDSRLSAAAPHTVAPWRQGLGRRRLWAWDGSGCGQGWSSLRAGSDPALPPPRGRGHFVGTRSGYSGPARSAGEAGAGDGVQPRFAGIPANRPADELDGGSGGGSTGPPSPAARGGPRGPPFQPCRCSLPSQGAAKHPRLLPCAVLQADPTRGEQQMGQGARPPLFPPDSWEWEHSSPKQVLRPKLGAECCWVPSSPHANCAIISCSVIAVGAIKWL